MRIVNFAPLLLLLAWDAAAATFNVQGTNLTVTSNNIQVSFSGADVTSITNKLTGESYLRSPSPNMQLNLTTVQSPSGSLAPVGSWTVNGVNASLTFSDSNRNITVNVTVDSTTQEVVVNLTGTAPHGGVEQLIWGVTGFDLTAGKLVVPAWGGMEITSASMTVQSSYYFSAMPGTHRSPYFRAIRAGSTSIPGIPTRCLRTWQFWETSRRRSTSSFTWRLPGRGVPLLRPGPSNGGWQLTRAIGRRAPASIETGTQVSPARAPEWWAVVGEQYETVVEEDGNPYQTSDLDSLASVLTPSKTLVYLVSWRTQQYDVGYPDYSWDASTPAFIAYAHQLGFRVMLHTDVLGVAPSSPDFAAVQQYQIKDPFTLQPRAGIGIFRPRHRKGMR